MPPNSPDYFTYFSDFPLKVGSLVEINFRQKNTVGYVYEVKELAKVRKEISSILPKIKKIKRIIIENSLIEKEEIFLAKFLANYFGFSLPAVFSYFFFPTKKFIEVQLRFSKKIKRNKFKLIFLKNLEEKILRKKRSLMILPEISFADEASQFLEKLRMPYLKFSPPWSKEKINKLIQELNQNDKKVILIPKNLVFLPWKNIDQIIVFREGSFFYYDNFKNINFDYRDLILKLAQIKNLPLFVFDNFPSSQTLKILNLKTKFPIKVKILNSLEEVLEKIKNFKKAIFFFPKKIVYGLRCENCFNFLKCPSCQHDLIYKEEKVFCPFCLKEINFQNNFCPFCKQKLEIGFKTINLPSFYKYLKKNYPEKTFLLLKKKRGFLKKLNQQKEFYLIGSLSLIAGNLPQSEAFFFFNFENFYFSSDPFLREKYLRILGFFQEKVKDIFLVSYLRNPLIETKILRGDYLEEIIKERELLRLNPFYKIIKLIKGGSDFSKLQQEMLKISKKLKEEIKETEVIGPILSKPFRLKKRYFLEIILRTKNEDLKLKEILLNFSFEKIKINPLEI